jgi:hypothetical protein
MGSAILINLVVFDSIITHAKEMAANHVSNVQDSTDELVDKLLDRALEVEPLHHAQLDNTTLGKAPRPGHLIIPPPPPPPTYSHFGTSEDCQVLPGNLGIQCLLGLCYAAILVFKKICEKSNRTWWEFALDSSKQLCGWILIQRLLFAQRMLPPGDECEWYWVMTVVDSTLGVYVDYLLLSYITGHFLKGENDYKTGHYKDAKGAISPCMYFKQLVVWLAVVTGMKFTTSMMVIQGAHQFTIAANYILKPVNGYPQLKFFTLMIATPLFMNSLQFWLVDNIIMKEDEDSRTKSLATQKS